MAVKTFAELIDRVRAYTSDRTDDETLSLLEDVNDTLKEDWQKKYEENDRDWRTRYKARFEGGTLEEPADETVEETESESREESITVNDLFKEG